MRVLTWNVQGAVPPQGSPDRIREQSAFIEEQAECPDVLLLNEVTTRRRELWRERLADIGYTHIEDTLDWANELGNLGVPPHHDLNHVNGNLTAVHESLGAKELIRKRPSIRAGPYDGADMKHWSTNFPEKILVATLELPTLSLQLWNVRAVPGNPWGEEKVKILETVVNRIRTTAEAPCLLAGDFNAPKDELPDGTLVPWRSDTDEPHAGRWKAAETGILRGLADEGMVDVFRDVHGYGDIEVRESDAGGDADKATRLLVGRLLHGPATVLRGLAAGAPDNGADLEAVERALERVFALSAADDGEEER